MGEFLIRVLFWASLILFCCAGCSQFPNQNYAAPEARGWGTRIKNSPIVFRAADREAPAEMIRLNPATSATVTPKNITATIAPTCPASKED